MLPVSFIVPSTAFRMKPLYCQQCVKDTVGCWRYRQNIQVETGHRASGPKDLLQHSKDTQRTKLAVCGIVFILCYVGAASCTKEDLFCLCLDGSWVSGEKILGSSERRRNVSALILKHWWKFCAVVRNKAAASHKGNLYEGVFDCWPLLYTGVFRSVFCAGFWGGGEGGVLKTLRTCLSSQMLDHNWS